MHKNPLWLLLLFIIAIATIWYGGRTIAHVVHYAHLKAHTLPESIDWSFHIINDDEYIPVAHYTYRVGIDEYHGVGSYKGVYARNQWGADLLLKELQSKEVIIWYNPKNPEHSALEKAYPLKELMYTVALCGLLIYFIGLGLYVGRHKEEGS